MQYRTMKSTGDKLSTLGYGCMRFPVKNGKIDEEKAEAQIRLAIGNGINYFDTAWPYHGGKSEEFLGKVLAKDGLRDKVKIATKLPTWLCQSREDMDKYLDAQLEALQTDHIDYYLLHTLDGLLWENLKKFEVLDFLDKAVESGKIIHKGFSFHGAREDFKKICDEGDWKFCQIQYNILDEFSQAGTEGLEYAASKGIGVTIMEPLRGGALAGKLPKQIQRLYDNSERNWSNAEWALRWVWDHKEVTVVLSGMNHEDQVNENLKTAETALPGSLSEKERKILAKVSKQYKKALKIPCTSCQYCLPCPAGVAIPRVFSHYNESCMLSDKVTPWAMYFLLLQEQEGHPAGFASQCIECGKCVKHCPQGIDIPKELKRVKRWFEGPLGFFIKIILNKTMKVDRTVE